MLNFSLPNKNMQTETDYWFTRTIRNEICPPGLPCVIFSMGTSRSVVESFDSIKYWPTPVDTGYLCGI